MRVKWIAALLAAALLLAGCGGGTDRTKAQVRLLNASSGYAGLDLDWDNTLVQGNVGYGASDSYVEVAPGKMVSIDSAGSPTALLSLTPSVNKDSHYTLLAFGRQGALQELQLDEEVGAPISGYALLRIVNAAPDVGAVDIYLTGANDTLAASVPVQSAVAVAALGSWLTLNSGSWRLRATAAGSKTDVRMDVSSLTLGNQQVATLVVTPGGGGVLANALLVLQQGAITQLNTGMARVRVAAGVAAGGAVGVTLGATALLASTSSPAVGAYALVPAGAQPLAVTVNGAALSPSTPTLSAGADYTLLVHGPVASPLADWVADDNHPPSDPTQANVRLVNGLATLGGLSMTVSFLPAGGGVALGTASGYTLVAPSTTATISVSAAGQVAPLYSANMQTFVAGGVYSVFVLGDDAAPAGVLRQDR